MSWFKALGKLERAGLDREAFEVLHRWATDHGDKRAGMHTNGGCREGACDYGSAKCRAWGLLMDIVARMPESQP